MRIIIFSSLYWIDIYLGFERIKPVGFVHSVNLSLSEGGS